MLEPSLLFNFTTEAMVFKLCLQQFASLHLSLIRCILTKNSAMFFCWGITFSYNGKNCTFVWTWCKKANNLQVELHHFTMQIFFYAKYCMTIKLATCYQKCSGWWPSQNIKTWCNTGLQWQLYLIELNRAALHYCMCANHSSVLILYLTVYA